MESNANVPNNRPDAFYELTSDQQRILKKWVSLNLKPIKSFNNFHSSYKLKHIFEDSTEGFYISNGQFKGAMLACEFKVKDKSKINWHFNISQKSNAFRN